MMSRAEQARDDLVRTFADPSMPASATSSLYDVLGVSRHADPEQIKDGFRSAVKAAHPDHGGSVDSFERVSHAYRVLSDPGTRFTYDCTLAESERSHRRSAAPPDWVYENSRRARGVTDPQTCPEPDAADVPLSVAEKMRSMFAGSGVWIRSGRS